METASYFYLFGVGRTYTFQAVVVVTEPKTHFIFCSRDLNLTAAKTQSLKTPINAVVPLPLFNDPV